MHCLVLFLTRELDDSVEAELPNEVRSCKERSAMISKETNTTEF